VIQLYPGDNYDAFCVFVGKHMIQRLGKEDALSGCHVSPAVQKQQV